MNASSSGRGRGKKASRSELTDRLLVAIACRLGPDIDRLDVEGQREKVLVRDLVVEFTTDDVVRPAAVRLALLDMIGQGWLSGSDAGDLLNPLEVVGLRLRGLAAARELEPGCGVPLSVVTLRMKHGRQSGLFAAKIDTGNAVRDRDTNRSGLTLAAFYVLAVKRPTEANPLLLSDCMLPFQRLAVAGVGPRSGPGSRLEVSPESISKAMDSMKFIAKRLTPSSTDDGRVAAWSLKGGLPDVRIEGASGGQAADWTWMHHNLGCVLRGEPFRDANGMQVGGSPATPKASTAGRPTPDA